MRRAGLYWRTVRNLRWQQIAHRAVHRLARRLPVGEAAGEPAADRNETLDARLRPLLGGDVATSRARAEAALDGRFEFAGVTRRIDDSSWTSAHGSSPLWTYNLHYFDFARDLARAWRDDGDEHAGRRLVQLIESWVAATRRKAGPAWDPYPTSVRLVNWVSVLVSVGDRMSPASHATLVRSLREQHAFLERHVEWHLLGNHVQKNLHALLVAGTALRHDVLRPRAWQRTLRRLRGQWAEQILPDGMHFERSPMYHALALHDLLESVAAIESAGGDAGPERALAERMLTAAGRFERSDGSWFLFNDSANGIAPNANDLRRAADGVGVTSRPLPAGGAWSLPNAGYHGVRDDEGGDRLVVDCGAPGPRYQPAHAHCDALSFEYDEAAGPIVVDAGVHGYGGDPFREYVRSTRAHNTVSIDGREQSEVWSVFRVARHAQVGEARVSFDQGTWRFGGACRPFHGVGTHRREITWRRARVDVVDRVDGAPGASLTSYVHVHPRFDVRLDTNRLVATDRSSGVEIVTFGDVTVRVVRGERSPVQGWYCPRFGVALPGAVLEITVARNRGEAFGYTVTHR